MSRVQRFGYSQLLDLTYQNVRYTLIIQNDKMAAYEATGMVVGKDQPPVDPVAAAQAAFVGASEVAGDFEISDKWFLGRWLELVSDRRETPIDEAGDFG